MDKDTFTERLADALEAEKPPEASYKGWFRKLALGTDIPQDSLKQYYEGIHECPGHRLLRLFDFLGPAFESRVRGTDPRPNDDVARRLRDLADEVEGNGSQVPKLVKTS